MLGGRGRVGTARIQYCQDRLSGLQSIYHQPLATSGQTQVCPVCGCFQYTLCGPRGRRTAACHALATGTLLGRWPGRRGKGTAGREGSLPQGRQRSWGGLTRASCHRSSRGRTGRRPRPATRGSGGVGNRLAAATWRGWLLVTCSHPVWPANQLVHAHSSHRPRDNAFLLTRQVLNATWPLPSRQSPKSCLQHFSQMMPVQKGTLARAMGTVMKTIWPNLHMGSRRRPPGDERSTGAWESRREHAGCTVHAAAQVCALGGTHHACMMPQRRACSCGGACRGRRG